MCIWLFCPTIDDVIHNNKANMGCFITSDIPPGIFFVYMGIMIRNMGFCRRYQQLLLRLLRSVLLIGKNLGKPPTRKYKVQSGKHLRYTIKQIRKAALYISLLIQYNIEDVLSEYLHYNSLYKLWKQNERNAKLLPRRRQFAVVPGK